MSTSPQRKRLPVNPSLEHLQKQAKRLAKQNPDLKLAAAQHQIAKEYGCKTWAELARMVEAMARRQDAEVDLDKRYEAMPKAARAGDLEQVRQLLVAGEFTPHTLDQSLAHALWYGDDSNWPARRELADLLLAQGADPNGQYGSGGYGPIIFGAGECLRPEGLEYLIAAGAEVTAAPIETKYGRQCVMSHVLGTYLRGANDQKHRCIEILLRHQAYVPPEVAPSVLAIHRGDLSALDALIAADPVLVEKRFADMPFGNIALTGATLLHCAAEFGEVGCLVLLLIRGADVNATADVINGIGGQSSIFHAIGCAADGDSGGLEMILRPSFGQFFGSGSAQLKAMSKLMQREPVLSQLLTIKKPFVRENAAVGLRLFEARSRVDFSIYANFRRFGQTTEPADPLEFGSGLSRKTERPGSDAALKLLRESFPLGMYTPRARKAIASALREAKRLGHDRVDTGHLLLALTGFSRGTVVDLLRTLGADPRALRLALESEMSTAGNFQPRLGYSLHGEDLKKVLEGAANGYRSGLGRRIDSADLFLSLLRVEQGVAAKVLRAAGIEYQRARAARELFITAPPPPPP